MNQDCWDLVVEFALTSVAAGCTFQLAPRFVPRLPARWRPTLLALGGDSTKPPSW